MSAVWVCETGWGNRKRGVFGLAGVLFSLHGKRWGNVEGKYGHQIALDDRFGHKHTHTHSLSLPHTHSRQ